MIHIQTEWKDLKASLGIGNANFADRIQSSNFKNIRISVQNHCTIERKFFARRKVRFIDSVEMKVRTSY